MCDEGQQTTAGGLGSPEHHWAQLYDELRRVATGILARERTPGSVHATVLLHEAFLKLQRERTCALDSREFVSGVAYAMRRILVDRARCRLRYKRAPRVGAPAPIQPDDIGTEVQPEVVLDVDLLLRELEQISPRRAEVLQLRFFGGLTEVEVAEVLAVSRRTVQTEFRSARAWVLARWGSEGLCGPS